jgi:transcriptional regulator with XRE-family HTH domain
MRKTIVADDYDDAVIEEADLVIRHLTIDGKEFSLDLREATSAKLNEALAPFLPAGTFGLPAPNLSTAAVEAPKCEAPRTTILGPGSHSIAFCQLPAGHAGEHQDVAGNRYTITIGASHALPLRDDDPPHDGQAPDDEPVLEATEPAVEAPEPVLSLDEIRLTGDQVRELRLERGWTQNELKQRLHQAGWIFRSESLLSSIENGLRRLTLAESKHMRRAFALPVPAPLHRCTDDGCTFSTDDKGGFKRHQQLAHGIGGESAAERDRRLYPEQHPEPAAPAAEPASWQPLDRTVTELNTLTPDDVRRERSARGWSQAHLANLIKPDITTFTLQQASISQIERGARFITAELQAALQKAFDSTPATYDASGPFTCNEPGCAYTHDNLHALRTHERAAHGSMQPESRGKSKPEPEPKPTKLFLCEKPDCDFASTQSNITKSHMRLKHGIGGKSAEQLNQEAAERRAAAEADKIKASVLEPLPEEKPDTPPAIPTPAAFAKLPPPRLLQPVHTIVPGVNVISERPAPRDVVVKYQQPASKPFGENTVELALQLTEYLDKFLHGLPEDVAFIYRDEVLALDGMDPQVVEDTLRNPHWVEIAEADSYRKGYAILRFHKADLTTVLGLRNPQEPAVIAHYRGEDPRAKQPATEDPRNLEKGSPWNPADSIRRLQRLGAEVEWDERDNVSAVPVTFQGQDLGKITVGTVPRSQVEIDYQRTIRKIAAIRDKIAS